jgi:hypothetical protein
MEDSYLIMDKNIEKIRNEIKLQMINLKTAEREGFITEFGRGQLECLDGLLYLLDYTLKAKDDENYMLEEFAKIVRSNLSSISEDVQKKFEDKYFDLTGKSMYGGFTD